MTELLVVIALIVLLVTLLLGALAQVQAKSRQTATFATMQSFANACDTFQQEHGFYPGLVPEDVLVSDAASGGGVPKISGTENAILHLMGGGYREVDYTPAQWTALPGYTISFNGPNGAYRIKVALERIGEGPIINDKPFAPYFTPGNKEFGVTSGQVPEPADPELVIPDLVDAWGEPIMYLRRARSIGPITATGGPNPPQFNMAGLQPYVRSVALGRLGRDQTVESILNTAPDIPATLAFMIEHPALVGQPRGAFVLFSAGRDGVYFSNRDGAGDPETPVDDIVTGNFGPDIVDEYDDVILFGGG